MALRLLLLVFLLAPGLSGCGESPAPEPQPAPAPAVAVPADPAEALTWVRAAELMPQTELRRRLAAWPTGPGPFFDAEETQVVLTWRIRLALQDGDVEEALAQRTHLRARFEGHGVSPQGRGLTPQMILWGVIEEALLQARLRMAGPRNDRRGARSALVIARDLLDAAEGVTDEDRVRLATARTWVELDTIDGLTSHPRIALPHGPSLASATAPHSRAARPWILAIADDFALGEETFAGPLERWQREGTDVGLRVAVIPWFCGQVRMGIRRVPAMDATSERTSVVERLAPRGLAVADEMEDGPFRFEDAASGLRDDLGARCADVLGLGRQHAAVLIVDARGHIVGRMDGVGLDLRDLDPVVQKLVSR